MRDETGTQRAAGTSLRGMVDAVFGRWPAWPWSVLGLLAGGGVAGFLVAPAVRAACAADGAALGDAACAGYGLVLAGLVALVPRCLKLADLYRGLVRRPADAGATWWPLDLLAGALVNTPTLRRTPQEFRSAVESAAGHTRSILADRLWPLWAAAFTAPVLGLITAWQNGARVQVLVQDGQDFAAVFPAFIAAVSPPMVATIGASLILMLAVVAIDQWGKALLRRWCATVDVADGDRPAVVQHLGGTDFRDVAAAPRAAPVAEPKLPTHDLDPDEIEARWRRSGGRGE